MKNSEIKNLASINEAKLTFKENQIKELKRDVDGLMQSVQKASTSLDDRKNINKLKKDKAALEDELLKRNKEV